MNYAGSFFVDSNGRTQEKLMGEYVNFAICLYSEYCVTMKYLLILVLYLQT